MVSKNVVAGFYWAGNKNTKYVFLCHVAAAGDDRYVVCAAVVPVVFPSAIGSSILVLQRVAFLHVSTRLWDLCLRIAVTWPRHCCHVQVPCARIEAGQPHETAKRTITKFLHRCLVQIDKYLCGIVANGTFWKPFCFRNYFFKGN